MSAINPKHYKQGKVECIEAIEAAITNKPPFEAYCVGNVVKYLWRYEAKNGLEDIKKAEWYLKRLIQHKESGMDLIFFAMDLIMNGEGFMPRIYTCPAGKPSVGYGRNLNAFPLTEEEKAQFTNAYGEIEITEEAARAWLKIQVERIYNEIKNEPYFKGGFKRQGVLIDMIFNLGKAKFLTFKNFIKAMEAEDFELAAKELENSRYYKQVGERAKRNAHIIRTGELPK